MLSNMALVRVGSPLWMGFIMTVGGVVAVCYAGRSSKAMFCTLCLLLGLAEAGAFASFQSTLSDL